MAIFNKRLIDSYIEKIDKNIIEHKFYNIYKKEFRPKIENIIKSKEEQYQYGFLNDFFVNILGYSLNPSPNYNLTTEFKNQKDSKKADGAILKNGLPIAVIELKSTKLKSLDKIESQAFNYKSNHPSCRYIITSNFETLRLYIDYSNEYEEFNIFNLNIDDFIKIYFLIEPDSILNHKLIDLKSSSKKSQEKIENIFYKEYSNIRLILFENIINKNKIGKDVALNLTQKILDRFIFIFFAEDKGIINKNTTQNLINQYKNDWESRELYHFIKILFSAIDKGNQRVGIGAYNGGLFRDDESLNQILIDDSVLLKILNLSNYDFDSEIDVNILGHIFENSLDDLEKIKDNLFGKEFDINKAKRKKDGIFYTPEYITKYIVENTVGKLCQDKKVELNLDNFDSTKNRLDKDEIENLESYKEFLKSLKILDPACGSGAFLNQAFNYLLIEYNFVFDSLKKLGAEKNNLLYYEDIDTSILENNLFGVDINEESVEIAKLSLWLKTAKKDRKLTTLANNIKCANSLLNMPFEDGSFDVVIGNPPYLDFRKIDENYKTNLTNFFSYKHSGKDKPNLYIYFIEKSISFLKKGALLSFINPIQMLVQNSSYGLRKFLIENTQINFIKDVSHLDVFDVSTYPIILNLKNTRNNNSKIFISKVKNIQELYSKNNFTIEKKEILNDKNLKIPTSFMGEIIKNIEKNTSQLRNICKINFCGTSKSGFGKEKMLKKDIENIQKYVPLIETSDIEKYHINWRGFYIPKNFYSDNKIKNLEKEKIIIARMTKSIKAVFDDKSFYLGKVNLLQEFTLESKYLLTLLNSKLINFWYREVFDSLHLKNGDFGFELPYLLDIPIKDISLENQQPFIKKANLMIELNQKLQETKQNFTNELKLEKISKKLQNFENLSFEEFIKEYAKAKNIKLSDKLKERNFKNEWKSLFENDQKEAIKLQNKIDITNSEIDNMVYKLYNLTEDEIKIIKEI